jgi:hypothetical protein
MNKKTPFVLFLLAIGVAGLVSAVAKAQGTSAVELQAGKTYAFRIRITPPIPTELEDGMKAGLVAGGATLITIVNASDQTVLAYQQPAAVTHTLTVGGPQAVSMGGQTFSFTYLAIEEVT